MDTKRKPIPAFKDESEERRFWETHDSTDYLDWRKAVRIRLPNLKPSRPKVSLGGATRRGNPPPGAQ